VEIQARAVALVAWRAAGRIGALHRLESRCPLLSRALPAHPRTAAEKGPQVRWPPTGSARAPSREGRGGHCEGYGDGRRGGVGRDPGLRGEVLTVEGLTQHLVASPRGTLNVLVGGTVSGDTVSSQQTVYGSASDLQVLKRIEIEIVGLPTVDDLQHVVGLVANVAVTFGGELAIEAGGIALNTIVDSAASRAASVAISIALSVATSSGRESAVRGTPTR
jgi:hypothetical protein